MPRLSCPKCGRDNSVAVYTTGLEENHYCFGANCNYRKYNKYELDSVYFDTLQYRGVQKTFDKSNLIEARSIPEALKYIQQYGIGGANTNIKYNINDQRIVFNYKDLYIGRCLIFGVLPKWYNYTNTDTPFKVQKNLTERTNAVILVEDCTSACKASSVLDAIALLGTTLKTEYIEEVLQYEKIYIALDEDATNKAIKIYDTLILLRECRIIPLKKDIKYLSTIEIEELLK